MHILIRIICILVLRLIIKSKHFYANLLPAILIFVRVLLFERLNIYYERYLLYGTAVYTGVGCLARDKDLLFIHFQMKKHGRPAIDKKNVTKRYRLWTRLCHTVINNTR